MRYIKHYEKVEEQQPFIKGEYMIWKMVEDKIKLPSNMYQGISPEEGNNFFLVQTLKGGKKQAGTGYPKPKNEYANGQILNVRWSTPDFMIRINVLYDYKDESYYDEGGKLGGRWKLVWRGTNLKKAKEKLKMMPAENRFDL